MISTALIAFTPLAIAVVFARLQRPRDPWDALARRDRCRDR